MTKSSLFVALFLTSTITFGQQPTLQDKLQSSMDINTQFATVLSQSRSQDADFKIIRKSNLEIIRKNINDSISTYKKEIAELRSHTSNSTNSLKQLQDTLQTLSQELQVEKTKTSTISFLGIDFNKETYHIMVWIIICALAILGVVFSFSFRKAKLDAVEHQKTAEEAQAELLTFKKKAMEKEQQLKRQLLDEQLKRNS